MRTAIRLELSLLERFTRIRAFRLSWARNVMVPIQMSSLLAIQPDSGQADLLRAALRAHTSEDVVVVSSLDEALSLIESDVPDVILLPTLMSASIEDYLVTYLGTVPGTGHVQILGLPHLERTIAEPPPRRRRSLFSLPRVLFPWRRANRVAQRAIDAPICDSEIFTRDVAGYLEAARALKRENAIYSQSAVSWEDRRSEPRFTNADVPWISFVRFGNDRAALIDVSARGVLLRTHVRPEHHYLRRSEFTTLRQPRLTFGLDSDREIQAIGRVIRCVPSRTSTRTQYEVAFCFDDAVGLHLPTSGALIPLGYDDAGSVEEMIVALR